METGKLTDQIEEITGTIPKVSDHVVDRAGDATIEHVGPDIAALLDGLTDKWGRKFDPKIHVTDADGQPVINVGDDKGFLRIKPGIRSPRPKVGKSVVVLPRKKKPQEKAAGSIPPTEQAGAGPEPKREPNFPPEVGAQLMSNVTFAIGRLAFHEDGNPIIDKETGLNEVDEIRAAWKGYFETQGVTNVPPWVLLAIAIGGYAARRIPMEKTQKRLGRALSRMGRAGKWILRKIGRGQDNGTQPDNRRDGKRENDTGKEDLQKAD